ncbi:MAG: NAD(P)-binding domain-containing protein [bacterium]|nr:NAD(P)-binding domain-containing protein [bacterium]
MSWLTLISVVTVLAAVLASLVARRRELARMATSIEARDEARERGTHRARLQYPDVDLSRCIGCGTCVAACPEEGVLGLVHGQSLVLHGARCVGHGRCARECPVGAIAITLGDLSERNDIPALTGELETAGVPGLFLAGEVTGYALIRTAIAHGTAVASEVARRAKEAGPVDEGVHELCIVGAGPAGIACSLQATAHGLDYITLEQEQLGGTVSKYPRKKLVMTQPAELPLHGRLSRTTYRKEELMELWTEIVATHDLPIRTGAAFIGLDRDARGIFQIPFGTDLIRARHVCLALGRRGTPRKLGVPGEELPKVAYGLVDAASYSSRRVLVVGGGDSAIEAALGLAEGGNNAVTLSYRRKAFVRIKARNEARILEALQAGRIRAVFESRVRVIEPDHVQLEQGPEDAPEFLRIPNDDVFVLAGGVPPFKLLEQSGVSFDAADRPAQETLTAGGSGLLPALSFAFLFSVGALAWTLLNRDYYAADALGRAAHALHETLRPSRGIGLGLGIGATALIATNLAYLVRRSPRLRFELGALTAWMTVHVATGVLALVLALLHAGLAPRHTVGGHALAALGILIVTGAIGRYFYAFVPRAANGRELALDEVKSSLATLSGEWERSHREFGARVRDELQALIDHGRWHGSTLRRLGALVFGQRRLARTLTELREVGEREGVAREHVQAVLTLARRAHRASLMAAHYEDLRGLMGSWRYLHRWIALAMVLLVVAHIVTALRFGGMFAR